MKCTNNIYRRRCSNSNYLVICINRNVYIFCCMKGVIRKIMYTDDLVIIAKLFYEHLPYFKLMYCYYIESSFMCAWTCYFVNILLMVRTTCLTCHMFVLIHTEQYTDIVADVPTVITWLFVSTETFTYFVA